jgi:2-keto-4-pentenoate hydratase
MSDHADIARAFVDARRRNTVLQSYPGPLPRSLAEAYQIQSRAIGYSDRVIGGWKLGRIRPDDVARFGAERLAGPIFADSILTASGKQSVEVEVLNGFAAVEAEILLRIAAVPPANLTTATAADYVDEVRLGIEIASSPFVGINQHGPAVTVSDFGNNHGLIVGPAIQDAKLPDGLDHLAVLEIDGTEVGRGLVSEMLDGPFGSLAFLARLTAERGLTLAPGQWVSSGAITGVHPIRHGQQVRARFGNTLTVHCTAIPVRYPQSVT